MIRSLSIIFACLQTLFLLIGIQGENQQAFYIVGFLNGIIWLLILTKRWKFALHAAFVIFYILAIFILNNNGKTIWIIISCSMAILSWDLERLNRTFASVDVVINQNHLLTRHLLNSISIVTISTTIALIASQVDLTLNLGLIGGLVLILLFIIKIGAVR